MKINCKNHNNKTLPVRQQLEQKDVAGRVLEFHRRFKVPHYFNPNRGISDDRKLLRTDLLREEVGELESAMLKNDLIGIADGIVDSIYILLGTAWEYGLGDKFYELFNEVHESNMSKLDKNLEPIYFSNGKVAKGENYFKPDLQKIINNPL